MARMLGDLFNIYHKVVMSILKIILTILTTFFFVHCGENDVKTDLFKEGLILFDDPAADGCGWLVYSGEVLYMPTNLTPDYQKDSLEILLTFDRLTSIAGCGPFKGAAYGEVEITDIKEGLIWYDDPSLDGCGWVIYNYTDSAGYKPVNLAPAYKIDTLVVLFTFDLLTSMFDCSPWNPSKKEIEITNIRPYPVWGFYQPDYEEIEITDIKLK